MIHAAAVVHCTTVAYCSWHCESWQDVAKVFLDWRLKGMMTRSKTQVIKIKAAVDSWTVTVELWRSHACASHARASYD
jgi:hypothetical protein